MSASRNTLYVFEPFMKVRINNNSINSLQLGQDNNVVSTIHSVLNRIFNCKKIPWLERHFQSKNVERCSETSSRVVKVIRVRFFTMLKLKDWIIQSDIKVIHLIRDPRAIMNSRENVHWQ